MRRGKAGRQDGVAERKKEVAVGSIKKKRRKKMAKHKYRKRMKENRHKNK